VKIYVAAVEAYQKRKGKMGSKQDETQFGTRSGAFLSLTPPVESANVPFCRFLKNLTRFWTKLRVLVPCFPDFTENPNIFFFFWHECT